MFSKNLLLQQHKHLWKQRLLIFIIFILNLNLSIYHVKKIQISKYSPKRVFLTFQLICSHPFLPSLEVQEGEISLHKLEMHQARACHTSPQGHLPTQYDEKDQRSLCVWLFSSEMSLQLSWWQQLWVCCVCVNDVSAYQPLQDKYIHFIFIYMHICRYLLTMYLAVLQQWCLTGYNKLFQSVSVEENSCNIWNVPSPHKNHGIFLKVYTCSVIKWCFSRNTPKMGST